MWLYTLVKMMENGLGSSCELRVIESAGRSPSLPLNSGEAGRVFTDCCRSPVCAHKRLRSKVPRLDSQALEILMAITRWGKALLICLSTSTGRPIDLRNLAARVIVPSLERCVCQERETEHANADHQFERDPSMPV